MYLWAVQNGRVLECSLGYYIQPLVVFALGAVIFKEKMSWRHFIIIGIVVVGIVLSASGFGGVPYVTIALALMFAVYAAIKKSRFHRVHHVGDTDDGARGAAFHPFLPHGR